MVNTNVQNDFTHSVKTYYKELKQCHPIQDREEERQLLKQAKKGDIDARNTIIKAHLKFVFDVAKKYRGKGVSINDLISEGNDGIIIAIDKFDLSNDTKFISYAVFWIRERMLSLIETTNNKTYRERSLDTLLMPSHIGSCEDDEIIDSHDILFPDTEEKHYDPRLNMVDKLIGTLNTKEKYVIKATYGIGCNSMTLKTLSKALNISAERVRQIKLSGIRKMRTFALLNEESETIF